MRGGLFHLLGDTVAILDSNGTAVVQYKYDAWGKPISKTGSMVSTLGKINPFRYRGYVYDEETGLYYLQSRFFSFVICRFLNADEILSGNIYAYCSNSPVAFCDASGKTCVCCFDENGFDTSFTSLWMIGGGGGSMMAGAVGVYGYAGPEKALEILLYPVYFPEKVLAFVVDNWLQGLVSAGTLAIASAIVKASQTLGHPYVGTGLAIFYVAASAFVGNTIQEGISSLYQDDYSDNPGIGGSTAAVEDAVFYGLSLSMDEDVSQILESFWGHFKYLVNQFVEALEE